MHSLSFDDFCIYFMIANLVGLRHEKIDHWVELFQYGLSGKRRWTGVTTHLAPREKMITTLAALLEAMRTTEAKVLRKHDIKHGPTIGNMYEGLTRKILSRAIPDELGVRRRLGRREKQQSRCVGGPCN
jgi:hypothetical protein